jgi:hypothetical protein
MCIHKTDNLGNYHAIITMSKRMIQSFFPAFSHSLNQFTISSFLYNDLLFPDSVAQACPEVSIPIQIIMGSEERRLRQPVLFVAAVWGMAIGFGGAFKLLKLNHHHRRWYHYWSLAFMAFGVMNVSAIFLHCLWTLSSIDDDSYPQVYPKMWILDTYMTGVSSICLSIASLELLLTKYCENHHNHHHERLLSMLFWSLQGIGVGCCIWFFLTSSSEKASVIVAATHPLELWYLVTPLAAGLPLIALMFGDIILPQQKNTTTNTTTCEWTRGHSLFVLGGSSVTVLGIGMDRFWCWTFGSRLWDLPTASTMTFLGCDLAFWGIQKWILSTSSSSMATSRTSSTKRQHVD